MTNERILQLAVDGSVGGFQDSLLDKQKVYVGRRDHATRYRERDEDR